MAQSKRPAICSECGKVGPKRPQAVKQGWTRASGGGATQSKWRCPEHPVKFSQPRETRQDKINRLMAVALMSLGARMR